VTRDASGGFCFFGSGESEALRSGHENKTRPALAGRGQFGNAKRRRIRPGIQKGDGDNPRRATTKRLSHK
jgi:hypothetical protein